MTQLPTAEPKIVWTPLQGSQTLAVSSPCNHTLYTGTRGPGKGLPLTEPVLTPTGFRPIGDLVVGDLICCPDGSTSEVVGVYPQGKRPIFKLTLADGSIARCDDLHIWRVHVGGNSPGSYANLGMLEVLKKFNSGWQRVNIPTLSCIYMNEQLVRVDPYLFGLMLGDGCFAQAMSYCTNDEQLAQYVLANDFRELSPDSRNGLRIFKPSIEMQTAIASLGVRKCRSHDKFIPKEYLNNSSKNRLSILQGLMDTNGRSDPKGYVSFCSVSEQLAKDVQYLARSLGAKATLTSKDMGVSKITGVAHRRAYSVYLQCATKFSPFRLIRKAIRVQSYMHKHLTNKICDIQELEPQESVCIKIAHQDGLFITNDFIVTHNTDAQIMFFRRHVGIGYGAFWKGVIFDRQYKNLDDLIQKTFRWFTKFEDGVRFLASKSDYRWVWPTGEQLLFRQVKEEKDYYNFHGQEFPFIGWNELTKYPTSKLYDLMMSCNRTSFLPNEHSPPNRSTGAMDVLPEIPLCVFSTTNPHGPGHNWVKERFIDASPAGKILKTVTNVFNPRTQKREDVIKTQVWLFGTYQENKYLSPEYVAELESIPDENKRKAWLHGDWDIVAGGVLDDLWGKHLIKPRMKIPRGCRLDRTFDWGSTTPFSIGWWAEANGEDFTLQDGTKWTPAKGSYIRIAEWYGAKANKSKTGYSNEGLMLAASTIADGIKLREKEMLDQGWINGPVVGGAADNQIRDVRERDVDSIEVKMAQRGVYWTPSDKGPGSRRNGLALLRDRMLNSKNNEKAGIYFLDNCRAAISTLPTLSRDPDNEEDVDTDGEDHAYDDVRYKCLSKSREVQIYRLRN